MDHRGAADTVRETRNPIEQTVDQLIRQLVHDDARSSAIDSASHAEADADEIILDIEMGGVRYVAIRCGSRQQHRNTVEEARLTGTSPDPSTPLSPREFEIARMVAKGYANKSIASILEISSWTVSSHLRRIYTKLGVTSRAAMVARLLDVNQADPTLSREVTEGHAE
jgi:DNA-binding CsgD family transcriptional regulator